MTGGRNTAGAEGAVQGLAARRVAHEAVASLIGPARGRSLEDALAEAARVTPLPPLDAGLARAIATATFRHFGAIRNVLGERLDRGFPENQPRLAALLATGAAQILSLDVPDHAAVDLSVRLAKDDQRLGHLAGLVNAVLRRLVRERGEVTLGAGDPLATNTPDWLAQRWRRTYGDEIASRIARAHLRPAEIDLSLRDEAARQAALPDGRMLDLGSLRLADHRTGIADLPGYREGRWWVQDAAAALPARLLDAKPGERVLDLCAAPGGKSAQLAAAGASVRAVDRSEQRLLRLRENLARLSLTAEVEAVDALELPETEAFDVVLLDAPCSATGTIRRHPEIAWTKSEADIARLAALQSRLLAKAARLVAPGGRLVFCTCSLEPEEGEAQIESFLARQPGFVRLPIGADEVAGHAELIDSRGDLRTLPCHLGGDSSEGQGGLDGFFAARFRRET